MVAEHPELFGPHAVENLRLEQILARLGERTYPRMEPDQALSKMGKEQLGDDVLHHTGEYVGFVATKIGRIWSHGPRAVMRSRSGRPSTGSSSASACSASPSSPTAAAGRRC